MAYYLFKVKLAQLKLCIGVPLLYLTKKKLFNFVVQFLLLLFLDSLIVNDMKTPLCAVITDEAVGA